jgi:hypothetical protein
VLVLIDSPNPSWNRKLQARMAKAGPDVAGRIRFVPSMPMPEFFALQRQADCLLDTFHFGGGCSSYEALGASAPVVTLPGDAMRARVTLGWYEALGERASARERCGRAGRLAAAHREGPSGPDGEPGRRPRARSVRRACGRGGALSRPAGSSLFPGGDVAEPHLPLARGP